MAEETDDIFDHITADTPEGDEFAEMLRETATVEVVNRNEDDSQ